MTLRNDIANLPLNLRDGDPYHNSHHGTVHRAVMAHDSRLDEVTAEVERRAPLTSPVFTGPVTAQGLTIPTGASAGKVLTSDAAGVASWKEAPTGGGGGGVVTPTENAGLFTIGALPASPTHDGLFLTGVLA